eukprot:Gb_12527 [translate_table: standard]
MLSPGEAMNVKFTVETWNGQRRDLVGGGKWFAVVGWDVPFKPPSLNLDIDTFVEHRNLELETRARGIDGDQVRKDNVERIVKMFLDGNDKKGTKLRKRAMDLKAATRIDVSSSGSSITHLDDYTKTQVFEEH